VEHKGQLYAGEQAAIIEPSMWEPIQDELRARHTGASGTVDNQPNALLNGLLFCHLCDRPMAHTYTAAHGRRYRYYVCRRAHQRGRVGCRSPLLYRTSSPVPPITSSKTWFCASYSRYSGVG
jgi:hypothetical protein